MWSSVSPLASIIGFLVLTVSNAGVFPALAAMTPLRIGEARAHHPIALQVSAGMAGGAAISALIGLLIIHSGLVVVGPTLLGLGLPVMAASATLDRLAPVVA